jgi:hypothetical protein
MSAAVSLSVIAGLLGTAVFAVLWALDRVKLERADASVRNMMFEVEHGAKKRRDLERLIAKRDDAIEDLLLTAEQCATPDIVRDELRRLLSTTDRRERTPRPRPPASDATDD